MEVFAVGSTVYIRKNIEASVIAVSIRRSSVQYEVVWWDGMSRKTDWVQAFEISKHDDSHNTKIGFLL
jgi:hypothetical protein